MHFLKKINQKLKEGNGFTLIELLVVVAIIGLLSSIVLTSLSEARTKAKYAAAQTELNQFIQAVIIAQGESGQPLINITGNYCSDCACRDQDIRNIPSGDACYTGWTDSLTAIQAATDGNFAGIDKLTRDPWGSPYGLDENELEYESDDCRMDTIRSAGPDGILYTEDDEGYVIPLQTPQPGCEYTPDESF